MKSGLLIVSHSHTLAASVVELAEALAGDEIPMVAAGGVETLGVNPQMILDGISVFGEDVEIGIIGDLGSSFLAASAALDLSDVGERVRIIDTPMVEGAIACAMALAMGGQLSDALAAGEHAWEVRKVGTD